MGAQRRRPEADPAPPLSAWSRCCPPRRVHLWSGCGDGQPGRVLSSSGLAHAKAEDSEFEAPTTAFPSAGRSWADADAALRLMLQQPVQYTTIPIRLFTRTNVSDVALTPGAEESGAWFGSTGYVREYERLWGVG